MWFWIAAIVAMPFVLYGLHRFCLRLEERGYLYYKHKQPKAGGTSPFLGLQEIYDPRSAHVLEVEDHSEERADDDRYLPDGFRPYKQGQSSNADDALP